MNKRHRWHRYSGLSIFKGEAHFEYAECDVCGVSRWRDIFGRLVYEDNECKEYFKPLPCNPLEEKEEAAQK